MQALSGKDAVKALEHGSIDFGFYDKSDNAAHGAAATSSSAAVPTGHPSKLARADWASYFVYLAMLL
jgi:hypothetical protein